MVIKVNFWPILVNFYLISHYLLSYHMIMAAKFQNFKFYLASQEILGKVTEFQRIISKALRVMDKNLWGVPKDPLGLNTPDNTVQQNKIFTVLKANKKLKDKSLSDQNKA